MIRQCAWCRSVIGQIMPLEDTRVTHGMCSLCYFNFMQSNDNSELLDDSLEDQEHDQNYARVIH
jgi:hypothetical protein